MADFSLSRPVLIRAKKGATILGNISWAVFVLFCFWAGSQAINLLINSPGMFEHLMQSDNVSRPHIDIGFGVNILFGLSVFSVGALVLGIAIIAARVRHTTRLH